MSKPQITARGRSRADRRSGVRSILLGGILVLGAHAASASATTMQDALVAAYENNPSLRAARAELRRTDEQVPQALAGWRPDAEVMAGGGLVAGGSGSDNMTSNSGPTAAFDLRVRQPIYNWVNGPTVRQAENAVRAQRARLAGAEQDVLLRGATAYVDVLRAQATLQLAVEQEQQLQRDLDSSRRRFDQGELRNSDVAQAEASVVRARAQRRTLEGNLATARESYRSVIGDAPGDLSFPDLPGDLPVSEQEALAASAASPAVVAANYAERAAEDGVDISFGQELPRMFLEGEARPNSASILGIITFPLYKGGSYDSQVRAAKQLVAQRREEADAQQRQARQSTAVAWEQLESARANVESYDAQVKASQIAADGIRREGGLGLRTVTDVLIAQQQVLEAKVNQIGARRDALVSAYQLLASTGHLTAMDMNLPVTRYDPARHYEDVRDKWGGRSTSDPQ
jgi:outer membrane protein